MTGCTLGPGSANAGWPAGHPPLSGGRVAHRLQGRTAVREGDRLAQVSEPGPLVETAVVPRRGFEVDGQGELPGVCQTGCQQGGPGSLAQIGRASCRESGENAEVAASVEEIRTGTAGT